MEKNGKRGRKKKPEEKVGIGGNGLEEGKVKALSTALNLEIWKESVKETGQLSMCSLSRERIYSILNVLGSK